MFRVILFSLNDTEQLGKETAYELTTGEFTQQYVSAHARLFAKHSDCYGDRCISHTQSLKPPALYNIHVS